MTDEPNKHALTIIANMKISTRAKAVLKHADEELAPGIAAPFAVIGYKGARWSVRARGNTTVLEQDDGSFVPFLDVVMLHAAAHHSKIYYAKTYQDGDDDVPDCWSTDGQKPDQAAPRKQATICANCKWNEFGSRTNANTGAKGKACGDVRRIAIVPYPDLENQIMGGPMLLRVPPASLAPFAEYSDFLKANGVPYPALVTRIGFDKKEAYPKYVFRPLVALSDDEVDRVAKMQAHSLVDRIVQQQLENIVDQVGSEQGAVSVPKQQGVVGAGEKPADMTPPEHLNRTNGAAAKPTVTQSDQVPHASTRPASKANPFAKAAGSGPSHQGSGEAIQRQQAAPGETAQTTAQTDPAGSAEALSPEQARIKELENQLAAAKAGTRAPAKRRSQPVAPSSEAQSLPPPDAEEGTIEGADDPALAAINARLDKVMQ